MYFYHRIPTLLPQDATTITISTTGYHYSYYRMPLVLLFLPQTTTISITALLPHISTTDYHLYHPTTISTTTNTLHSKKKPEFKASPNVSTIAPFIPKNYSYPDSFSFNNYSSFQYSPDLYYNHHSAFPLQHHLYAPSPYQSQYLKPHQRTPHNYFIPNNLRQTLLANNTASLQSLPASSLPEIVHLYHSLVPLHTSSNQNSIASHPYFIYKACSNLDGLHYALVRIKDFRLQNEKAISAVSPWVNLSCPASVVPLKEAFSTQAFSDDSLIFVYQYFPNAQTLISFHSSSPPENIIWSYIVQLLIALKPIHAANLAVRTLSPNHIIVSESAIRLNACGILDVINFPDPAPVQQDITDLANLILFLTNTPSLVSLSTSSVYSHQLYTFVADALDNKPLDHLISLSATQSLSVLNNALSFNSVLENTLATELENARLVRLLCKLDSVAAHLSSDPLSTKYPLSLFRNHLFRQSDQNGRPVVDLAHILRELNKLDAGIDEQLLLLAPDNVTFMIVSYKELKELVASAFRELRAE